MSKQNKDWKKKNIWNLSGFLKNKFLRICPYGKKKLDSLVSECSRTMFVLSVLMVCILFLWNAMFENNSFLYILESIVLSLYLVCMEVPNYFLQEKEDKVYKELILYFSRVKHQYSSCHHIGNAVVNAADGMSYEIEQLAWKMYRILLECNRKEKLREYIECYEVNRYWKMFFIQAYEISEKGNVYFAENVEHIRLELMEEIYRRRRRQYAYSGYVFVTITPFFMLPILKSWGLEFNPELDFFYAGTGRILETIIFLVTISVYNLVIRAKEIKMFSGTKRERVFNADVIYNTDIMRNFVKRIECAEGNMSVALRKLLLQAGEYVSYGRFCTRIIFGAVAAFFALALFFTTNHWQERKAILERVENIEEIAPVVSAEKKEILEKYILEITELCKTEQNAEDEMIRFLLRKRIRLGNEFTEQAVVEAIKEKLYLYAKTKGTVLEVFFCILGSVGVGFFPVIQLILQSRMIRSEAEYEVKQFQSILLMERRIPGVTIVSLLEDMESFSNCFKNVLRRCINYYGTHSKEALLRLKRDGSDLYAGFEALADAFLSVDEVGIENAFAEIENDRILLEKMSRLEAEVAQEKKRDMMELLAQVPMVISVGAYFIFPFFLYSLQSVSEVFKLLEEMQK